MRCTGRTTVFTKEAAEGEEAPEPTEAESEQGPEPLSTLEKDAEVEGGEAWTSLFSSTNSGVKNQVDQSVACPCATFPQEGILGQSTHQGHGQCQSQGLGLVRCLSLHQ